MGRLGLAREGGEDLARWMGESMKCKQSLAFERGGIWKYGDYVRDMGAATEGRECE